MSIHHLTTRRGSEDAEDLELLKRVAAKDKVAFERLYARFYPRLTRYLSRMMRRPDLVEEVVSDTLFVVWQKADGFQGRSKVSTWITGIAYLKGIKALDKLKTQPEQHAGELDDNEPVPETHDFIQKIGLEEWLVSGLSQISADQRSVIELTYFSGHSYQEIADIMQCPVNTIKTRMFHARRRLAKLLPVLAQGAESSNTLEEFLQSESGELEK
jgi:RNA polymerase sigma-70 factor (ECF subfamily)